MATEKKTNSIAELKKFIKTHEMRYLVREECNAVVIKKAYRIVLEDGEHFVRFRYSTMPVVLTQNEVKKYLFKTMEEAKAKAKQMKEAREAKKKKDIENLREALAYMESLSYYDVVDDNRRTREEYKDIVMSINHLYNRYMPNDMNDQYNYIKVLENYIRTSSITTQGISFPKQQVVSVKYGKDDSVEIELANGMTIIPASRQVAKLVRLVMGGSLDGWHYKTVSFPRGDRDNVTEK